MGEGTGWGFRLASAKARLSRLPAARWPACHSRGVPSRSSGPPSPCTRNSYPPQNLTEALGPRLEEGERKHIFITVIEPDTFAAGRPRSRGSPPSGFLLSCCVFWMASPGVCCVNVHGNVMHLPHPGAVSSSPWAHPPPHLQHCWGSAAGAAAGLDHSSQQPYCVLATWERGVQTGAPAKLAPETSLSVTLSGSVSGGGKVEDAKRYYEPEGV